MFDFVCYGAALFVCVCIALIIGSICTVRDIKKPSDEPPCCGSCCPSGGPDNPRFWAYGRFVLDRERPYACVAFSRPEIAEAVAMQCREGNENDIYRWVSRSEFDEFRYQLHGEAIGTGCLA